jgi:hypothetical protein
MELRDHPLMSYRGLESWPPTWIWINGPERKSVRGEIGILREVRESNVSASNRFFLVIQDGENEYMGCLMVEEESFCDQMIQLLKTQCGRSIAAIGSLDISHTL